MTQAPLLMNYDGFESHKNRKAREQVDAWAYKWPHLAANAAGW